MKNVLSTALTVLFATTPIFADQMDVKTALQNLQKTGRPVITSQNKTIEALKSEMAKKANSEKQTFKVIKDAVSADKKENKLNGPADPGGGGFYKDPTTGKLKSVPEMGLIIQQTYDRAFEEVYKTQKYPKLYPISQQLRSVVEKVVKRTPLISAEQVLPSRDTFLEGHIDEVEYQKIKADYVRALSMLKIGVDHSQFNLCAFSKNNKTYILDCFEQLSDEQKAVNLIHEHFMRSITTMEASKKLVNIWLLEVEIWNLLKVKEFSDLSMLNYFKALANLVPGAKPYVDGYIYSIRTTKIRNIVIELTQKLNRPILLGELILDDSRSYTRASGALNPSLTQKFNETIPLFAEMTEQSWISVDSLIEQTYGGNRHPSEEERKKYFAITEKAKKICAAHQNILETSDVRNDYLVYFDTDLNKLFAADCTPTTSDNEARAATVNISAPSK